MNTARLWCALAALTLATYCLQPALGQGGPNTSVQYNNSGTFGGESEFNYDQTANSLQVPVVNNIRYANRYATGGDGSSSNPWTGWTSAVASNSKVVFPPGYYGVGTSATLASDLEIDCSQGAIFKRTSSTLSTHVFTTSSSISRVTIQGCTFDDGGLAVAGNEIRMVSGESGYVITDVLIARNAWINITNRLSSAPPIAFTADLPANMSRRIRISSNRFLATTQITSAPNTVELIAGSDLFVDSNHVFGLGGFKLEHTYAGSGPMKRLWFVNNTIESIDQSVLFVRPNTSSGAGTGPIEGVYVIGNTINCGTQTNPKCGIGIGEVVGSGSYRTTKNVVVANNQFRGSRGDGIQIGNSPGGATNLDGGSFNVRNVTIVGNSYDGRDDAGNLSSSHQGAFMNINYTAGVVVANNVGRYVPRGIRASGQDIRITNNYLEYPIANEILSPEPTLEGCIAIYGSLAAAFPTKGVEVTGNTCRNTATSALASGYTTQAIFIDADVTNVRVTGNFLVDDRSPAGMEYGITLRNASPQSNEVDINNNVIIGAATGGISHTTTTETRRFWNNPTGTGVNVIGFSNTVQVPKLDFGGDVLSYRATCSGPECVVHDLDSDSTVEAGDVCLVDGGIDADCDGQSLAPVCAAVSVNPPSISALSTGNVDATITGVATGQTCVCNPQLDWADDLIPKFCTAQAANTVRFYFYNATAASLDAAATTVNVCCWPQD